MNDNQPTLADMIDTDNSVTVLFCKDGGRETATFENGATAYNVNGSPIASCGCTDGVRLVITPAGMLAEMTRNLQKSP